MKIDKVAALLLFASALGASVFVMLAQKEHLFAVANDFPENPDGSSGPEAITYMPSDNRNIGGDSFLYEKQISESEYAFLEDRRQLERRN